MQTHRETDMKLIDITRPFQAALLYPNTEPPVIEQISSIAGSGWNVSRVTADSHTGTHADAPSHCLTDGCAIDETDLRLYCGRCRVLTFPENSRIGADELRGRIQGAHRLAIHGGGSAFLLGSGAEYLAACGVKAVVTDAVSVAPPDNEAEIHAALLAAGIAIVENADLSAAPDGEYLLFAFPVKYTGCDAAPVRAVLLAEEQ